ncbi:hypothetical protein PVAND_016424 [Polypedilum vanderplanki]|uniref:glutathione transferase n=1 Tax=Polypedilum vanderplanki TaxID=319348 RepID=A0A9J6BFE1_POLVA|nr:hypothetical protein PVAND_016424 [Polypedilum vanderplanki]
MVVYKLHYFNLTGLGEPIRFLFHYGGIDFEDVRYEMNEWVDLKKKFPLGQLPVLEIDDKEHVQSMAICRYLAKQVGLAGDSDLENMEIDAVVDTFNDIRLKISTVMWEQNQEVKKEKQKILHEQQIPFYFKKLDEYAEANNGHFACKKLTWADLYIASWSKYFSYAIKEVFNDYENYPNIKKVVDNVLAIENIKKWVETRPDTFC